jgi:hypothetical protein
MRLIPLFGAAALALSTAALAQVASRPVEDKQSTTGEDVPDNAVLPDNSLSDLANGAAAETANDTAPPEGGEGDPTTRPPKL